MDVNKFIAITRKYKKCPKCSSPWEEDKLQVTLTDDKVVTISCECGFLREVDENNNEIKEK
jgi:Zn ribbon nucleic-acid-binding protein